MTTKYQIAIFSNGRRSLTNRLKKTLRIKVRELGINRRWLVFLESESSIRHRNPKAPTVAVYIGTSTPRTPSKGLMTLIQNGTMVVPVFRGSFHANVTKALWPINGLQLRSNDPNLEGVAAVLLEGLNLLRKRRRLFISYRRAETQGVAIQLYEGLDQRGFDVFLDTVSIRPGEPFQEVLWHRLADTDVVVLLDSPEFMHSRWTVAELAQANTTNVQVLQLVWPKQPIEEIAAFSKAVVLSQRDFDNRLSVGLGARLKQQVANKVFVEVESLRARSLAARYTYLVEEFCTEARSAGFAAHFQLQRFITLRRNSGARVGIVPAIGVPDAVSYHEAETEVARHRQRHSEVILLYDERGIQQKWVAHLKWLNRHKLPVRSLQVAESSKWLEKLR